MKKLAILQMLLLPLASLAQCFGASAHAEIEVSSQQQAEQGALACNPWSANYRGDVVVHTQAEAAAGVSGIGSLEPLQITHCY